MAMEAVIQVKLSLEQVERFQALKGSLESACLAVLGAKHSTPAEKEEANTAMAMLTDTNVLRVLMALGLEAAKHQDPSVFWAKLLDLGVLRGRPTTKAAPDRAKQRRY